MAKAKRRSKSPATPGPELEVRPAWRRDDARIEADAIAFWERLGILPAGVKPQDRARELVAAAYSDGRLVGVTTASLNLYEPLRARLAFQRCAVEPELRRSQVGSALTRFSFDLLEQWSAAHPEEKVPGFGGIIESPDLREFQRRPVWGDGLSLVGHLADGRQVRVAWFAHAGGSDAQGWSGRLLADAEVKLDLRFAWRLNDATLERDAIAFWQRLDILPPDVKPAERAKELAAAAYQDGRLVGVSTVSLHRYEPLRGRFAFYRCAVEPEQRRTLAATALTAFARDRIEQWSAEHPEERVLGLAAIVESTELVQRQRYPVWENSRLNLAGYLADGRQLRVAWFAHARVE